MNPEQRAVAIFDDEAYAMELLCGAILIACIIDGRIAPKSFGLSDGLSLIEAMKKNSRFDSVMLISNSGGGKIAGAHGHLEKSYDRQKFYLPKLSALVGMYLHYTF